MSVSYIAPLPISPRPRTTEERLDLIDHRLAAMSTELQDMLAIITRIAQRLDEVAL